MNDFEFYSAPPRIWPCDIYHAILEKRCPLLTKEGRDATVEKYGLQTTAMLALAEISYDLLHEDLEAILKECKIQPKRQISEYNSVILVDPLNLNYFRRNKNLFNNIANSDGASDGNFLFYLTHMLRHLVEDKETPLFGILPNGYYSPEEINALDLSETE